MAKLRDAMVFGVPHLVYERADIADRVREAAQGLDADKIHLCMLLLNLQWASIRDVPSPEQIRTVATELATKALKEGPGHSWSSGGLHADVDAEGRLLISFVLTAAYEEIDEETGGFVTVVVGSKRPVNIVSPTGESR